MLTYEQSQVLSYLKGRFAVTLDEVSVCCLRTGARAWAERVLADLEWLGMVTVFPGQPPRLQITDRGADCLGQLSPSAPGYV